MRAINQPMAEQANSVSAKAPTNGLHWSGTGTTSIANANAALTTTLQVDFDTSRSLSVLDRRGHYVSVPSSPLKKHEAYPEWAGPTSKSKW